MRFKKILRRQVDESQLERTISSNTTILGVAHLKKRVASVGVRPAAVVESGNRTQGRFWSCRDPLRTGTIPLSPQRFSPSRDGVLKGAPAPMFAYVSLVSVKKLPDYAALTKTSIENPDVYGTQSHPVTEARKPLLFIDSCWCREGESNPQGTKYRRILSPLRLPVPPSRLEEATC
jgi:hypothetical protein